MIKGFFLGILANALGIYLYVTLFLSGSFESAMEMAYYNDLLGAVIGLGAILNLLLFFFLLAGSIGSFKKKQQLYEARGVLMATVIAALAVLYFEM